MDVVRQALASVRLEGLEPGHEAHAIYQSYIDGAVTLEQMGAEIEALHYSPGVPDSSWAKSMRCTRSGKETAAPNGNSSERWGLRPGSESIGAAPLAIK